MNLLDQTLSHFNTQEVCQIDNIKELSDIAIIAKYSVINPQNVKKYTNQYTVDVAKVNKYT